LIWGLVFAVLGSKYGLFVALNNAIKIWKVGMHWNIGFYGLFLTRFGEINNG
jgi:hypothetical protein